MSKNIILVIGSVTAEQYKLARLEALSSGIKPKIVRLKDDSDLMAIRERYEEDSYEYLGDGASVEIEQDPWKYIHETFFAVTGNSVDDVIGFVVDEKTWFHHENFFINSSPVINTGEYGPLLDVDIRYCAHVDGRVELL